MRLTRNSVPGETHPDADPGGAVDYELARLPRDITTAITWFMKENGVTKSELARRLKLTPGRVSQILSGDENLTLRTLAMVCAALGAHFEMDLVANGRPAQGAPSLAPSPRAVARLSS
jgi:transcriptional regulator with XRE-family HTH domain